MQSGSQQQSKSQKDGVRLQWQKEDTCAPVRHDTVSSINDRLMSFVFIFEL